MTLEEFKKKYGTDTASLLIKRAAKKIEASSTATTSIKGLTDALLEAAGDLQSALKSKIVVGALAGIALSGCMHDVSAYKRCADGIRIEDASQDCSKPERDLRDVHEYLRAIGLNTASPGTVLFRSSNNFEYPDGRWGSGFTSVGWMETNNSASSLAHEMLHQREGSLLIVGTSWHEGWSSKGFNGLDMFWSWIATGDVLYPVGKSFCGWYEDMRDDHAKLLKSAGYPVDEWRRARERARASERCMPEAR